MVEGKSRVIDFGNDRYKHEIDLVARTLNGVKFRDVIHNARRNIKKADEQEVKARTPVNALDPKEYSEDFFMVLRYGSPDARISDAEALASASPKMNKFRDAMRVYSDRLNIAEALILIGNAIRQERPKMAKVLLEKAGEQQEKADALHSDIGL